MIIFETHRNFLSLREYDYNTFYIQFYQFYTSKIVSSDSYFYDMYKKELNFKYPIRSGEKSETLLKMESLHVSILLSPINYLDPIQILYNNSEIYYNDEMINYSGLSFESFYYGAYSYIGFLRNFLTGYKYYNNEITNYYAKNILDKKIDAQKQITLYLVIIIICFIIFSLSFFIVFYLDTRILFAKYLFSHTQLRYFNNYLFKKTVLIYEFIDNNQNYKMQEILNQIKFDNDLDQVSNIKYILSGQIEKYNLIKLRPLSISYKGIITNNNNNNIDIAKTIIDESKEGIAAILKRSSFFNQPKIINKQSTFNIENLKNKMNKNFEEAKRKTSLKIKLEDFKKKDHNKKPHIKDKNVSNRVGMNSSNRTNITNSTFNSSLNLVNSRHSSFFEKQNNQINQVGHKPLQKPLLYFKLFLALLICGTILLIICLIYYSISTKLVKSFNSIINTFRSVFANIKFITEMLIIYELSILENKPLSYEYEFTQYSLSCDALSYLYENNITEHEIFSELSTCFPYFRPKVEEILLGECDSKLKNLIEYQNIIEGKNFCENFSKFIINNINDPKVRDLKIIQIMTYDIVKGQCENIGNGFNKEGFSTAVTSMYSSLNSLYLDFKKNENRTEESNYMLLNRDEIIMFQLESYYVFTKVPLGYYIVMNKDLEYIHKFAIEMEIILLSLQFLISFFIILVYILNVIKYRDEITSVEFFNKSILHMILFEK